MAQPLICQPSDDPIHLWDRAVRIPPPIEVEGGFAYWSPKKYMLLPYDQTIREDYADPIEYNSWILRVLIEAHISCGLIDIQVMLADESRVSFGDLRRQIAYPGLTSGSDGVLDSTINLVHDRNQKIGTAFLDLIPQMTCSTSKIEQAIKMSKEFIGKGIVEVSQRSALLDKVLASDFFHRVPNKEKFAEQVITMGSDLEALGLSLDSNNRQDIVAFATKMARDCLPPRLVTPFLVEIQRVLI
jgi:hypothetical protein